MSFKSVSDKKDNRRCSGVETNMAFKKGETNEGQTIGGGMITTRVATNALLVLKRLLPLTALQDAARRSCIP